tara:strand:- start:174 stop:530 length:357 start_codon:yes stop_codon:yes gene_type:complete
MPRAKPDEVIIHRIELGSWERDHLSAVFSTTAIRNVAEPAVALISDVSAMSLILGLGAGFWGFQWVRGEYEDTMEMIEDWRTQLEASPQYREAAERGFEQGSPWPDFIDRWVFGKIFD